MPTGNIIRSVRQTVLRKAISHLLCNRFDTLHGQRIRPRHRQHNLLVGVDDAADRVGAGLMDDGVERQDFERSVPLSTETKGREERPLLAPSGRSFVRCSIMPKCAIFSVRCSADSGGSGNPVAYLLTCCRHSSARVESTNVPGIVWHVLSLRCPVHGVVKEVCPSLAVGVGLATIMLSGCGAGLTLPGSNSSK